MKHHIKVLIVFYIKTYSTLSYFFYDYKSDLL